MIKKNITFKLTVGFLSIVIISTLIIGIISLSVFKNNIYRIKRNNMRKHALEVSQTLSPYILNNTNNKEFIKIINLLDSIEPAKVWVVDSKNNIITASKDNINVIYIENTDVKKVYSQIIKRVLSGNEVYDEINNPYYNEYMMTAALPIKDTSGNILGAVILNSPLSDISNSMDKFFLYLILALIAETSVAGLMSYYFSKSISKPIKIINSSALKLAKGHYGIKTNIYQQDEIGELSNSFDLLSLKLKHTISELFQEKNKLSNIISSMSEGILAFDMNFRIININQASLNLLSIKNITTDENINDILPDINISKEFNSIMHNNIGSSIVKEYSGKILNFSISPVKDSSNEVIGGVILIQDISQKEKLEQMRKDFISNVSHEFRTPLTVIKGHLESIIDGMTPKDNIADTCRIILKETNRLTRMVKDLLNLSRLESGRLETDFNTLDVNSLINDTLRNLKRLINKNCITLKLSLSDNLPKVLSDYDMLKQLLIIFLDNAIKFSSNNGILKVTTYAEGKNIYITIEDNGIGIPKDEIQYLGEKFFKSDKSRNTMTEGTGLGLSIAKRLVKVLNGYYSIESELGKGTIVTISLPSSQN